MTINPYYLCCYHSPRTSLLLILLLLLLPMQVFRGRVEGKGLVRVLQKRLVRFNLIETNR